MKRVVCGTSTSSSPQMCWQFDGSRMANACYGEKHDRLAFARLRGMAEALTMCPAGVAKLCILRSRASSSSEAKQLGRQGQRLTAAAKVKQMGALA